MSRKCRAGVAGCRASTASCRASIARVSRNIARVSKMMHNSVSCVFYFAGTKNTDYHFDAGDFSASANQSPKFFVLDCVLLVTDIFWQTGGLIGGHGASSQRVSPKTRPKEARRMLNAGVALFTQGFIARMPLSKPRLGCRGIFSCVSSATAATKQVWTAQLWVGPNMFPCHVDSAKKSAAVCRVAICTGCISVRFFFWSNWGPMSLLSQQEFPFASSNKRVSSH